MVSFQGWEIRACILLSLFLQIFLNVSGTLRKLASRRWIVKILWLAYLLAEFVAVFGLGLIVSRQSLIYSYSKDAMDPRVKVYCKEDCEEDHHILMYWATFFLVHLGGPDTITAFAMEDNELWPRNLFYLASKCIAVAYALYQSVKTTHEIRIPIIFMFFYGIIKCTERTCALYYGSAKSFHNSMLSKKECKILIKGDGEALSHIEVLHCAFEFFTTFKGLVVDLSLGIHERNKSRDFFLARSGKDAFRLVEVELNYLYDVLFTKIPVLHHKVGLCCRTLSFIAIVSSSVLFYFDYGESQKIDVKVTYSLFIGAFMLEVISSYMLLFCDWTIVKLRPWPDANPNRKSWNDKFIIGYILSFNNYIGALCHSCLRLIGDDENESKFTDSRWANSLSAFNLIYYCLHKCLIGREHFYNYVGLLRFLNWFLYVKPKPLPRYIATFIFNELKKKSETASSLAVAKQICSSKGEWVLNELMVKDRDTFLPFVVNYNYYDTLLLWHIATELCFYNHIQEEQDQVTNINDIQADQDQVTNTELRDTAKQLSDYMLYLMVMKPDMILSGVSSIGETKFRDTCTEFTKLFDIKLSEPKKRKFCNFFRRKNQEEKEALPKKACETILRINKEFDQHVTVQMDRDIFFNACVLAKELDLLPSENKWSIISKLWAELLSYAASHIRPSAHAEQLSKGGELITVVWLLMAHFGLGEQYDINPGKQA